MADAVEDPAVSNPLPRVSVVIPAFNAAATLSEALDSLVKQSLVDWEAIVVDDGSSDATAELAQRRGREDPRIRALRQENAGASAARNAGIANARAPALVFLDADDWLAPDHLARLAEVLEGDETAVAYCGYSRVRADGASITYNWSPEIAEHPYEVFAQRSAAAIHCFMVRRDLLLKVGGFDPSLRTCEDWDLWQRIARTGARFSGVPATLAHYRVKQDSLSSDHRRMLVDAIEVISRAQGPDPRVRKPDLRYAGGTHVVDGAESAALFAVWCAASAAAKGHDASSLLDELPSVPSLGSRLDDVCSTIYDGVVTGGQLRSSDMAAAWPRVCATLSPLLERLEQVPGGPGLAYHVRSTLERKILACEGVQEPIILTTWMALRVDLRNPIAAIEPPPGIDGIDCRICAGEMQLAKIELLVFGAISAGSLARAIVESIGWRTAVKQRTLLGRGQYWLRLLLHDFTAAPRLGRAAILRILGQQIPIRAMARETVRGMVCRALTAPEQRPPLPGNDLRIEQILAEERSAVLARCKPLDVGGANGQRSNREAEQRTDRKTFWEKLFERADPWNYGSIYEQRKYAQTLSLLEDGPIERALELGCAEGLFTKQLALNVRHLIAVDISERALDRGRARCRAHPNVEFRQIDFFDDPIPGENELIVCSEVLYFLNDKAHLARVAEKIAGALAQGGRLLTAHAFLLGDDPTRTGFDWEQPFGATTICKAFQAAGLMLEKSIRTELYRVDLFRRDELGQVACLPSIRTEPFGSPLDPEVESGVVWGGAVVRRRDLASVETMSIPVLLYHRVADEGPASLSDYRVTPGAFEAQMRFLRRHGYHTISSADLERHRRERRPMQGRPVLITFDDGYRDVYDVAWPILRRHGFTAEVFLPTNFIGGTADWDRGHGTPAELMSWQDVGVAQAQGLRFGSHLDTHTPASGLNAEALLREGARSQAILERKLGCDVRSVAVPFGACDERTVRVLHLCGFTQIFTTEPGQANIDSRSMVIPRIAISGRDTIETFAAKLGESVAEPGAMDSPLVAVIVPAFNAEKTIDETLRSVREQTYRHLEILVVDDGSTDKTALLVAEHAKADPRVRLIQQANGGVAAARNRAIAEAKADFIAPIDADDVWMPSKLEKQMAVMLSRGPRCGLVYTWQAVIDEQGTVISPRSGPDEEGYVLPRLLIGNLVGSGSPALMRKRAIMEAGGYDTSLRASHAQGCEDFKLYLLISERYQFAVIREHLTGYRFRRDAMSMDLLQMLRSYDLVAAYAERAHPGYAQSILGGRINYCQSLFLQALRHWHLRVAVILFFKLLRRDPWNLLKLLLPLPYRAFRYAVRGATGRDHKRSGTMAFLPQLDCETALQLETPRLTVRSQGGNSLVASK